MNERSKGLEKRLLERAEKEAGDIESILRELKRSIEAELGDSEYQQLELFSDPEREQFERNKDFPAGPGEADPRRDRAGDSGDPGSVRQSSGSDVPGGGDVSGVPAKLS